MSSAETASTTPTDCCLMSIALCREARIPVTTTSCNSCGSDDLGAAAGASAVSAANSVLLKAMEPNVKPDMPNLAYVALSATAREALAALRNAFRRVFRLIRNPPNLKNVANTQRQAAV